MLYEALFRIYTSCASVYNQMYSDKTKVKKQQNNVIEIDIESFFIICGGVCIFGLGVLLIALAYHTIIDGIVKNRLFRNPPPKDRV
jgi:hypothetical protein